MNYNHRDHCITKLFVVLTAVLLLSTAWAGEEKKEPQKQEKKMASIYDFKMADIDGNDVNLADYKGKVLLIVNVASKCGFTPQYKGLQTLYSKYKEKGFEVLGFPANNFMRQEPGSNEQIKKFCQLKYNVSFPMFSKISVKGKDIHPLYKFLTEKKTNPQFPGEIKWNFNKLLIDRKGKIVNRFDSNVKPMDAYVIKAIEKALKQEK